jgi:lipid-A-disaccharide synthase-like uncharacterized protein
MTKKEKLFSNIIGYVGMICIQSSTLPVTYKVLIGETTHIPPMSMVALVWIGIIFYLIRALMQKDMVHITSNTIGFITQSALLALIVFK